jgi:hypothetical protein
MSNIETFDRTDEGFINNIDPQAARRQLSMSLGMVVVLAAATVAAAFTLQIEPIPVKNAPVTMVVQAPQLVHVRQAATEMKRQPGG